MASNSTLNSFPPGLPKFVGKATDSVMDRSEFPPKLNKSVDKETQSQRFSPEKLVMHLVFTEFGLSPVTKPPSTQLPLTPPKPYTTSRSSSPFSLLEVELTRSHQEASMKTKNGALKIRKQCRCKRSRCLKLYCECFASGVYCDGCGCNCCRNNVENEDLRQEAKEIIEERNPYAFRPKIVSSSNGAQLDLNDTKDISRFGKHNWGCHCKKTECLKKYCECFHAKVFCSKNCKCADCKNCEDYVKKVALSGNHYNNSNIYNNFKGYEKSVILSGGEESKTSISKNIEGSEGRKVIANEEKGEANIDNNLEQCQDEMAFPSWESYNKTVCVKQANAVVAGSHGLSGPSISQTSMKRKLQEFLGSYDKDPPIQKLKNHQKVNPFSVSSSLYVDPTDHVDSSAMMGSPEFHCSSKSSFTNIIQVRDIQGLCSRLVIVSKAALKFLGKNGTSHIQTVPEIQAADIAEGQDLENLQKGPGTMGLLTSETDELFTGTSKQGLIPIHGCNGDVYAEQERLVLTSFSGCLKRIINGNMKEKLKQNPKQITITPVEGSLFQIQVNKLTSGL